MRKEDINFAGLETWNLMLQAKELFVFQVCSYNIWDIILV